MNRLEVQEIYDRLKEPESVDYLQKDVFDKLETVLERIPEAQKD